MEELTLDASGVRALPDDHQPSAVLDWLSQLVQELHRADPDTVSAEHQRFVSRELAQLIDLIDKAKDTKASLTSKPLRLAVSKLYELVYSAPSTSELYESANRLATLVAGTKSDKNNDMKHLATACLGSLFAVSGHNIVSMAPLVVQSLIKCLKQASSNAGFRYSILNTLSKISGASGDVLDDSLVKDLWKHARAHSTDRSAKCAAAAFDVFGALITQRIVFRTASEFDSFKSMCFKSLESPYPVVRLAATRAFGNAIIQLHTLATTKREEESEQKAIKSKKQSSATPGIDDDEENPKRPSSAGSGRREKHITFYSLTFSESLEMLVAAYVHNGVTPRTRTGLVHILSFTVTTMEPSFIEARYFEIANALLVGLLGHENFSSAASSSHKCVMARNHVSYILTDVIASRILGELNQLTAAKLLAQEILKNYPAVLKEQVEPSKLTLLATLHCLSRLIKFLGPAISPITELLRTTLLQILVNPSYSISVAACLCLRELVEAVPSQILPLLTIGLNHISRELSNTATQSGPATAKSPGKERVLGHAYMTAMLVSLTNNYPQYTSLELASRVLSTAMALLKGGGNVTTVTIQVEVGWYLISGLMALGANFVKVHVSQLLLLWKTALQKPTGKEHIADRSPIEINYILHVRNCGLGSILAFLKFNSQLVTVDVGRRLSVMLQNVAAVLATIPKKLLVDESAQRLDKSLSLKDCDDLVRRRLFQCYLHLAFTGSSTAVINETLPASILTSALTTFADPEKNSTSELSTAIAAGTGTIDTIWDVADNHAYGLTSGVQGFDTCLDLKDYAKEDRDEKQHWLSEVSSQDSLENYLKVPVVSAPEFDNRCLLSEEADAKYSPPPVTDVVDLSISVFAVLLQSQTPKVQESLLDQLRTYISTANQGSKKSSGRRDAVAINSSLALHQLLNYTIVSNQKDNISNPRVLRILLDITRKFVSEPDPFARNLAAQSLGMICSIGPSTVVAEVIKSLIDDIVSNRDPHSRGGCSLALGYILKFSSGMLVGIHLKTVLGVLVSLANDPHPIVHFWALESIRVIVENTGLNFAGYASSTLSTLQKLYLLESHSDEVPSTASSNLDLEYPTTRVIARCVYGLITVLGPDLQESSKSLLHVVTLREQFEVSENPYVVADAIRCSEELAIFVPQKVDYRYLATRLLRDLRRLDMAPLRHLASHGLYQLIRMRGAAVFELAGSSLETDIWMALDYTPNDADLRSFIETWLEQTAAENTFEWIARVQQVLSQPRSAFRPKAAKSESAEKPREIDLQDEEGASFASSGNDSGPKSDANSANEPLCWQTRALAIEMLRQLVRILMKGKPLKQRQASPLVSKVGDVVKVAFSASTAPVLELRLLGLSLLDEVLLEFQDIPDPDFSGAALLEQYQAQIGSALTPAFSADSSPELAFKAIKVCATFIGSGIIKDVSRMGRILKLLTVALESCSSSHVSLGDLQIGSPNAQVMLRLAILSLWAELQVSSVCEGQEYLKDVVEPHVAVLVPLWISVLREFARLRFEPDQSSGMSARSPTGQMDQLYSSLSRANVLPTYQKSWLQLVEAIASLVEADSDLVFNIMHERETSVSSETNDEIKYSSEPSAFFFVLFGLCFEALVRPQQSLGSTDSDQRLKVLLALKRILHRSLSGAAVYKDTVLAETIDVLDRVLLTGTLAEQRAVVSTAYNLCVSHPGGAKLTADGKEQELGDIPESVDQLFELFRVAILPMTMIFPFLSDRDISGSGSVRDAEHVLFVKECFESLVGMIGVFPKVIKVDLYACLLYVFEKILEEQNCQMFVPGLLPIHKRLLQMMLKTRATSAEDAQVIDQAVVTAFSRIMSLHKSIDGSGEVQIAQRRNCLLASMVIVSTCAESLRSEVQGLIDLGELLAENISIPELSVVVAECAKTVLVATINTEAGRILAESALPPLISLVTGGREDEGDEKKKIYVIPKLVNDILTGYALGLSGTQVTHGLALVLPTLCYFLGDESMGIPVAQRKQYVRQRLVELATHDGDAFRTIVREDLTPFQRQALEQALRGDGSGSAQKEDGGEDTPRMHIQLKSFT